MTCVSSIVSLSFDVRCKNVTVSYTQFCISEDNLANIIIPLPLLILNVLIKYVSSSLMQVNDKVSVAVNFHKAVFYHTRLALSHEFSRSAKCISFILSHDNNPIAITTSDILMLMPLTLTIKIFLILW